MINKEGTKALRRITEEEEPEEEQPVEGISSALLQAFLGNMRERLQESNRQMETILRETLNRVRDDTRLEVQNFVRCFDQYEAYYNVPSRYY